VERRRISISSIIAFAPGQRGKLISLATETDRHAFFRFPPRRTRHDQNYKVRFHLYTVPGQVFYNATRKLVLKGADGVIFVADSQRAMLDANLESMTTSAIISRNRVSTFPISHGDPVQQAGPSRYSFSRRR